MAPPALPGFNATTSLSAADATGPGPRGLPVAVAAAVVVGFPCFMCVPSIHAVVSTPAELQSAFVAHFLCNTGLPQQSEGSASATRVSGPNRTFTCVTACIFAGSPSDPFHRRLRRIRCLLRRFDCYWASDPSQAGLSPARIHTHSRRTDCPLFIFLQRHAARQFRTSCFSARGTRQPMPLVLGHVGLDLRQFPHLVPQRLGIAAGEAFRRSVGIRSASEASPRRTPRRGSTAAHVSCAPAARRVSSSTCVSSRRVWHGDALCWAATRSSAAFSGHVRVLPPGLPVSQSGPAATRQRHGLPGSSRHRVLVESSVALLRWTA